MAPVHKLLQADQNKVQYDFYGYVTLLAPALESHGPNGIGNGTAAFLRLRQLQWGATLLLDHLAALTSASYVSIGIDVTSK